MPAEPNVNLKIFDVDLKQDDWDTCFSPTQDVYIDTGFLNDDPSAPYVIFKWQDWVKMIRAQQDDWWDGILLESRLIRSNPLDGYEMTLWLTWWACRYLRAGKIYDLEVAGDCEESAVRA